MLDDSSMEPNVHIEYDVDYKAGRRMTMNLGTYMLDHLYDPLEVSIFSVRRILYTELLHGEG